MPYVRRGRKVYKKTINGLKLKGESDSEAKAKRHIRALYAVEGKPKKRKKKRSR